MANGLNSVSLIGRLTDDADTLKDYPVCTFFIASNSTYFTHTDREEVSYFECTAWGEIAENNSKHLTKGRRIAITGSLHQQRWEDDNGETQSKIDIKVKSLHFLDSHKDEIAIPAID